MCISQPIHHYIQQIKSQKHFFSDTPILNRLSTTFITKCFKEKKISKWFMVNKDQLCR